MGTERARSLEATVIRLGSTAKAEYLRWRGARDTGARAPEPAGGLIGFTVEGVVDEQPVRARWSNGGLRCDESLQRRALLLIDLGEELVYTDPSQTLRGDPGRQAGRHRAHPSTGV